MLTLSAIALSAQLSATELLVGTYTQSESKGIYSIKFDGEHFSELKAVASVGNPSFVIPINDGFLSVSENENGTLEAYLTEQSQSLSAQGSWPCHIAVSLQGDWVSVSNYGGGNLSLYRLEGSSLSYHTSHQNNGKGFNPERQTAPHMHWSGWHTNTNLYSVDLGLDSIFMYSGDDYVNKSVALKVQPGDGPRHMAFHSNGTTAYIVTELTNQLITATINDDGTFSSQLRQSTLPENYQDTSYIAHIQVVGNDLYVSNRGHNSISHFDISEPNSPKSKGHRSTEGQWPRAF